MEGLIKKRVCPKLESNTNPGLDGFIEETPGWAVDNIVKALEVSSEKFVQGDADDWTTDMILQLSRRPAWACSVVALQLASSSRLK